LGYYSDLEILGGYQGAKHFTPWVYDIVKNYLSFQKVNKIIKLLPQKICQTDFIIKSQNEVNSLLILAHALGVSRP